MHADDFEAALRAFQESRILLTAIELNVFTALEGGATAGEAARRLGTCPRATEMLLNALAALELLRKRGDVFENGPLAATLLVDGSPENSRLAMLHTVYRWHTWSTLTDRVRGAVPSEEFRMLDPGRYEALLAMQNRRARERAPRLVTAIGTQGVRRMLDIGGGTAAYSIAFTTASRDIEAEVLELPEVVAITKRYIAASGLADRVHTRSGDLLSDDLGSGYDLILLFSLTHLLGEQENRFLLERCHRALAPGGRVAIHDHILEATKTAPRAGAIFALNMLVATSNGGTYSYDQYASWLRDAGFADVQRREMKGETGVVIGLR